MPNWVSNELVVVSKDEFLLAVFKKSIAKPYTTEFRRSELVDGKWERVPQITVNRSAFSFWNIVSPDPFLFAQYFSDENVYNTIQTPVDDPNWWSDLMEATSKSNNWYEWNLRNWGTKWEATNVDCHQESPFILKYTFDTAWGCVDDLMVRLSAKYESLKFFYNACYEDGERVSMVIEDGTVLEQEDSGPPSSHEESEEVWGECYRCQDNDEEDWFEDCPRPEEKECNFCLKVDCRCDEEYEADKDRRLERELD